MTPGTNPGVGKTVAAGAPPVYRPAVATVRAIQPYVPARFALARVVQRVGVTTVQVNDIFTRNHVAASGPAALRAYRQEGRTVPTTYVTRAPQTGDIQQTRDRSGGGRGLSDQVADYTAPNAYVVSGGTGGRPYQVSRYQNLNVVLKGNAQPERGRRGYIFHVTGVHRANGGTLLTTWEFQNGPNQAPVVTYPRPAVAPPVAVPQPVLAPPQKVVAPQPVLPVPLTPPRPVAPATVAPPAQQGASARSNWSLWDYAPALGAAAGYILLSYFGGTVMAKRKGTGTSTVPAPPPNLRLGGTRPPFLR